MLLRLPCLLGMLLLWLLLSLLSLLVLVLSLLVLVRLLPLLLWLLVLLQLLQLLRLLLHAWQNHVLRCFRLQHRTGKQTCTRGSLLGHHRCGRRQRLLSGIRVGRHPLARRFQFASAVFQCRSETHQFRVQHCVSQRVVAKVDGETA